MAPLATNLTRRIYFDYVSSTTAVVAQEHTVMWRHAFDAVDAGALAIQQKFLDFLTLFTAAGFYSGWKVTGVRVSEGNQTFSVPVVMLAGLAAFVGTGSVASAIASSAAIEVVFVGRSPLTGRRTRFSIYGRTYNTITDFRDSAAAATLNAVALLNAATAPRLVALDNTVAVWNQYANLNYNSYWEGELRV